MKPDPHGGWRRVVPSPKPYSIVETPVIATLVAGGVDRDRGGRRRRAGDREGPTLIGKEGVVDKDLAAAILAHEVEASVLLILTDVAKVQRGYGTLLPEDIDRMTAEEAEALLRTGSSARGRWARRSRPRSISCGRAARGPVIADLEDRVGGAPGRGRDGDRRGRLGAAGRPARVPELLHDHEDREQRRR